MSDLEGLWALVASSLRSDATVTAQALGLLNHVDFMNSYLVYIVYCFDKHNSFQYTNMYRYADDSTLYQDV